MERPNLSPDTPVHFTAQDLQAITGAEKPFESIDQFKEYFETVKSQKEIVKETVPYEFPDEFSKNMVEYYKTHGDVKPYVQNNVDYSKLEAIDLIKRQIATENEGLSERAINALVAKEMEQFKIEEDTPEDERTLREELLGVKANKLRNKFTEEQKKFMAPEKPSVNIEDWKNKVSENGSTKNLVTNKAIPFKFGEGGDMSEFNLEVDNPQSLVEMTVDNTEFFKKFINEKGETNFDLWYKVAAYVSNPNAFESLLVNHGKSIGTESVAKEIKNQQLGGKGTPGKNDGGILQAIIDRGVRK